MARFTKQLFLQRYTSRIGKSLTFVSPMEHFYVIWQFKFTPAYFLPTTRRHEIFNENWQNFNAAHFYDFKSSRRFVQSDSSTRNYPVVKKKQKKKKKEGKRGRKKERKKKEGRGKGKREKDNSHRMNI